jgi:hypothetical protein
LVIVVCTNLYAIDCWTNRDVFAFSVKQKKGLIKGINLKFSENYLSNSFKSSFILTCLLY